MPSTGPVYARIQDASDYADALTWAGVQTFSAGVVVNKSSGGLVGSFTGDATTGYLRVGSTGFTTQVGGDTTVGAYVGVKKGSGTGGGLAFPSAGDIIPITLDSSGVTAAPDATVALGRSSIRFSSLFTCNATISASGSSSVPLTVNLAASQSAHAFDIKNSGGTVLSYFASDGSLVCPAAGYIQGGVIYCDAIYDTATTGPTVAVGSASLRVQARSAAQVPFIVKGTTSQTGNLQQWQDNNGTAVALMSAGGAAQVAGVQSNFGGTVLFDAGYSITGTRVSAYNSSSVALTVQLAASQSANAVEIKSSAAAVLLGVTAAGDITRQDGTNLTLRCAGNIDYYISNVHRFRMAGGYFSPMDDAVTTGLGQATARWTNIYTAQGTFQGANGNSAAVKVISELITLSTSGTTTDSSADLLPINCIILAVTARVTTTITTATNWSVGDNATAARFISAQSVLTAGTTAVGTNQFQGSVSTDAAGPVQTSNKKVRITTTGTPGAGAIRVTVHYIELTPATS
jgi:hypothetical protein